MSKIRKESKASVEALVAIFFAGFLSRLGHLQMHVCAVVLLRLVSSPLPLPFIAFIAFIALPFIALHLPLPFIAVNVFIALPFIALHLPLPLPFTAFIAFIAFITFRRNSWAGT